MLIVVIPKRRFIMLQSKTVKGLGLALILCVSSQSQGFFSWNDLTSKVPSWMKTKKAAFCLVSGVAFGAMAGRIFSTFKNPGTIRCIRLNSHQFKNIAYDVSDLPIKPTRYWNRLPEEIEVGMQVVTEEFTKKVVVRTLQGEWLFTAFDGVVMGSNEETIVCQCAGNSYEGNQGHKISDQKLVNKMKPLLEIETWS